MTAFQMAPVCEHCNQWPTGDGDIWCSWCGHRLVSVWASLTQSAYTLDQLLPPRANLTLENKSASSSIAVQDIEPSADWIRIDWNGQPRPLVIGPHDKKVLRYRVVTDGLPPNSYNRGYIVIRSDVGEDRVALDVTPPREVAVLALYDNDYRVPRPFDIVLDGRNLERNLIRLKLSSGVGVLEAAAVDDPDLAQIKPVPGVALPATLDANQPERSYVDFQFDINEDRLMQDRTLQYPAERKVRLDFRFKDSSHSHPVDIKLWRPPQLQIPDEYPYSIPTVAGQAGEITLTLQNRSALFGATNAGNAPLVVNQIELKGPNGLSAAFLQAPQDVQFPLEIPGGGERKLVYRFRTMDSDTSTADLLGVGLHEVQFELITNYVKVSRKVQKEICVERIADFEGVLAVDFGTSNSCVALFRDEDLASELLPVNDHTTTPSIIQYIQPATSAQGAKNLIGEQVVTYYSQKFLRSIVRSPKLQLGVEGAKGTFEVAYYDTDDVKRLPARQVVADFLRALREAAEKRERARFRRIAFTHPVAFQPDQIQDLRDAILDAFGEDCKLEAMSEPVAAALKSLTEVELLAQDHYTLAVFDFGGGTTDLSLMKVENKRDGDRIDIWPHQTASTGRKFGGENLTGYIAAYSWERAQGFMSSRHPGAIFIHDRNTPDPNLKALALSNDEKLHEWAERTKLDLAYGREKLEGQFDVEFTVRMPDGTEQSVKDLMPNTEGVIRHTEFDGWLKKELGVLVEDLKAMCRKSNIETPTYILLSGKSSQIPTVQQVLSQAFPDSKILVALEPKQCVVEGACVPYLLGRSADIILRTRNAGFNCTTARIGYEELRPGRVVFFREVFPQDVAIPEEGLIFTRPKYPLRKNMQLRLKQNTSSVQDEVTKNNSNLREIGNYIPDPAALDLKPGDFFDSELEIRLSRSFEIKVSAKLEDGRVIPFIRRNSSGKGV